jgi:hypothetical protein
MSNKTIILVTAIALTTGAFGPGPVYQLDTAGPYLSLWPTGMPYNGGKRRSRNRSWGTKQRHTAKMRRRVA